METAVNVNVEIPPSFEPILLQRAAAAGKEVGLFIREFVTENLIARLEPVRKRKMSHEEFRQRLDAWIARQPVLDHDVDDSLEAIYEGCGE